MEAMENERDIRDLRGLVATVNLTGLVTSETQDSLLKLALHNASTGFTNIEYLTFQAQLVEAGRDAVLEHMLRNRYDFALMFDGDALFPPDALVKLLQTAFITHGDSDAVGAYAQLKGSFLPTIDTGSGTWEPHFPGEGVLPAIRTGGHFLLVKPSAVQCMGPSPWFRTRRTLRPVDALREVDNFARVTLAGSNPFVQLSEWTRLMDAAAKDATAGEGHVGEDSGFCDRLLASGGKLYVDTNVVTGHLSKQVITPEDLKKMLRERDRKVALACGCS